jgi:hypothetical protein
MPPPQVVPSLAPSARTIDHVIRQASSLEQGLVSVLAKLGGGHAAKPPIASTSTSTSTQRPPSAYQARPLDAPPPPAAETYVAQTYLPEAIAVGEGQAISGDGMRRRRVS